MRAKLSPIPPTAPEPVGAERIQFGVDGGSATLVIRLYLDGMQLRTHPVACNSITRARLCTQHRVSAHPHSHDAQRAHTTRIIYAHRGRNDGWIFQLMASAYAHASVCMGVFAQLRHCRFDRTTGTKDTGEIRSLCKYNTFQMCAFGYMHLVNRHPAKQNNFPTPRSAQRLPFEYD